MVDLKKSVPEKDIEAFSLWGDGVRMLMSIPESRKNLRQNMVLYKRHTNIYSRGNYKGAPKSSQRKKKAISQGCRLIFDHLKSSHISLVPYNTHKS